MTWRSPRDFAEQIDDPARIAHGQIRRMTLTFADGTLWELTGITSPHAGTERAEAEVFGTLGVYATPAEGGEAEAILGAVGDSRSAVIIGARDEVTRAAAAAAAGYQPGDVMLYNASTIAVLRSSGVLEVFTHGGLQNVKRIPSLEELNDTIDVVRGHVHEIGVGTGVFTGTPFQAVTGIPPVPIAPPVAVTLMDAEGVDVLRSE